MLISVNVTLYKYVFKKAVLRQQFVFNNNFHEKFVLTQWFK